MSQSTIKVEGFVANEPELRALPDGTPVLTLSVPHQRRQRNERTNEWESIGPTTWHSISLFGDEAEAFAPLVRKQTRIIAEGFAELRLWEKDGKHGAELLVRRARVGIIPRVQRQQAPAQRPQAEPQPDAWSAGGYGDDTPF